MIPTGRLVMLDTNIIVYLARGGAAGRWIDQQYQLGTRTERPLCSIVSVGESLGIAAKRGWGSEKSHRLLTAMRNLVIVQVGQGKIVERYGAIAAFLEATGQPIQQNDMWIAASASETSSVLLTTDRDFERLHPTHVEVEWPRPTSAGMPGDLSVDISNSPPGRRRAPWCYWPAP